MAAILHDVVENTPWTMGELKEEGFSKTVIKAVASLSRDPREPYQEYVDRVKKDTLAVKIKLADLEDNMDLRRLPELSDQNVDWIKRYHNHWLALRKANNGNSS
jgi:(p)ppGpp synthase/HD superfamily hydrolase